MKLLSRFALIDIRLQIEAGKILAYDLLGFVALDAFCAGIPTYDFPARIEREDGIVLHALDQYAKALLALEKSRLRPLAFGDIADGCCDQDTFWALQRAQADLYWKLPAVLPQAPEVSLFTH